MKKTMEQNKKWKNILSTFGNLEYDKDGITTHWAKKERFFIIGLGQLDNI